MIPFDKVLIANRGEIACRVIATCRRLGIATVAVYSEADAQARHVRLADEAYCVGPAAARDSYLRIDRILEVAQRSGAQAIHPGYGFLSENAAFAQACADAGIVFIGPPVDAIRAMGSKSAAKTRMQAAGVPLVPGYHGDDQQPSRLQAEADHIGYPVLIKASTGGGGKGMRVVHAAADFIAALQSCQREAASSFGDERVLIERYLQQPRHIEIQVFADQQGQTISLHERDCSAQRRHQKVVEEAPAPGISDAQRSAMGQAACDAARAVGYVGAGTVEFIADGRDSSRFYFMEMNTRLQVEHPVTEMITGLDLVEWQLRIAAGEPLPLTQAQVPLRGHAIEVRLYAEEPEKGFLPSIGKLSWFSTGAPSPHLRLDSGVEAGDEVTPHYDPMLAKLIVWDTTRDAAVQRMLAALAQTQIAGVGHNVAFLSRLIGHAAFRRGEIDTGLIERESEILLAAPARLPWNAVAAAALAQLDDEHAATTDTPWAADGWRLNGALRRSFTYRCGEQVVPCAIDYVGPGRYRIDDIEATVSRQPDGRLNLRLGERACVATVVAEGLQRDVFIDGLQYRLRYDDPLAHDAASDEAGGSLLAPMPGKIISLLVEPGATVTQGQALLVMEAMKMEMTVCAPRAGVVAAYRCAVGEQVREGVELVDLQSSTSD